MIRSRVFLAFSLSFSFIALVTYAFVDFREREDKAYDLYQSESYLKVLGLYQEKEIPSSELELTILSETISQLEKKLEREGNNQRASILFPITFGNQTCRMGNHSWNLLPYSGSIPSQFKKTMVTVTKELSSQRL